VLARSLAAEYLIGARAKFLGFAIGQVGPFSLDVLQSSTSGQFGVSYILRNKQ